MNLNDKNTLNFLKNQWIFDSIQTSKTAILTENKNIIFTDIEIDLDNRIISTNFVYKELIFQISNIYTPPNPSNKKLFFKKQLPQLKENSINIIAGDFNTNLYSEIDKTREVVSLQDIIRV